MGAAVDFGYQLYRSGGNFSCVSLWELGGAALQGGLFGATLGLSAAPEMALGAASAGEAAAGAAPDFLVSPRGTAFPVPKGASGPSTVFKLGRKRDRGCIHGRCWWSKRTSIDNSADESHIAKRGITRISQWICKIREFIWARRRSIYRTHTSEFSKPLSVELSNQMPSLINKTIHSIRRIEDYSQILFTDGSILNIFNPFDLHMVSRENLDGRRISSVESRGELIELILDPEGAISVSMRNMDYRGPEAMEYILNDGSRVVWS